MQIRKSIVTSTGTGVLLTFGAALFLGGPAVAAPSTTPQPSATATSAQPTPSAPTTVGPSSAAPIPLSSVPVSPPAESTSPAGIEVPAGNAGTSTRAPGGVSDGDIVALLAAGVALVGGGSVLAVKRRS